MYLCMSTSLYATASHSYFKKFLFQLQYLLKRSQETRTSGNVRGYGMSLVGTNEHGHGTGWNMGHINHNHLSYQVSGGADGSGDIYNWGNVTALARGIEYDMHFAKIRPQRVHLVVADGECNLNDSRAMFGSQCHRCSWIYRHLLQVDLMLKETRNVKKSCRKS